MTSKWAKIINVVDIRILEPVLAAIAVPEGRMRKPKEKETETKVINFIMLEVSLCRRGDLQK